MAGVHRKILVVTSTRPLLDSLKRRGAKHTIRRASRKLLKKLRSHCPTTHDAGSKKPEVQMRWYIPASKWYPIVVVVDLDGLVFGEMADVHSWKSPLTDPEVGKPAGVVWVVDKPPFIFKYNLDAVYKIRISQHQ